MVSRASGAVADLDRAPATPPANSSFAVSVTSVVCLRFSGDMPGAIPSDVDRSRATALESARKAGLKLDIRVCIYTV